MWHFPLRIPMLRFQLGDYIYSVCLSIRTIFLKIVPRKVGVTSCLSFQCLSFPAALGLFWITQFWLRKTLQARRASFNPSLGCLWRAHVRMGSGGGFLTAIKKMEHRFGSCSMGGTSRFQASCVTGHGSFQNHFKKQHSKELLWSWCTPTGKIKMKSRPSLCHINECLD